MLTQLVRSIDWKNTKAFSTGGPQAAIFINSGDLWSFSPHLSSEHVREGFWAMSGPGIRQGRVVDASILDMAPTLQKIFGLSIPDDVDGKVVQSIFEEHLVARIPR